MSVVLHHASCLDALRDIPNASIDAVVTDPPYGISFMRNRWDYDVPEVPVWQECLRVLKPGGYLLAFAGARTQHRMAVRIEDAGFEIRDMIAWIYSNGFPKSRRGEWGGTALKPAMEPITVARKPLMGSISANWNAYGTGGLNIEDCRVGGAGDDYYANCSGDRGHDGHRGVVGATNIRAAGGQASPLGRWPANVIHDGSEAVVDLFPQAPGQKAAVGPEQGAKGRVNVFNPFGPRAAMAPRDGAGTAARFFYCAKASASDRNAGLEGMPPRPFGMSGGAAAAVARGEAYDRHDGGMNCVTLRKNHHPTVKPTALMRYLCRLVTPRGGVVLDPYMGSGSTGRAAVLEGLGFIGIEREADFVEIARARIAAARAEVDARPPVNGDLFVDQQATRFA